MVNEEKSLEVLEKQVVQLSEEEALNQFGEDAIIQAQNDWYQQGGNSYLEYLAASSSLQQVYDGSYNHGLGDENEEHKIKYTNPDGSTYVPQFNESWLVSDDPKVVEFAQNGINDAQDFLEKMKEVNGINK